MIGGRALLVGGCLVVAALAAVAWLSPEPGRVTDRAIYEATGEQGVVMDCSDLHCFRVLVPWVLGRLPGPSLMKWKVYAVISNAAAAAAVPALCVAWGLAPRVAWLAALLSAFGFGSLYTLHDVFTSDPLMFALGPAVVLLVLRDRFAVAGAVASIGVLAKEFAAAPVYIFAASRFVEGRRDAAFRALAAANCALIVWLVLQLTLMLQFNYGYGDNPSTHLLSGGYVATWWSKQSPRGALSAMFNEFGVMWILAPVGFLIAPAVMRRYALMCIPVAALFGYVQQPDRALWNFHFVVTPLAALALDRTPRVMAWLVVGAFAVANLRVGAQLTGVPAARFTLALSVAAAVAGMAWAWLTGRFGRTPGAAVA